MSCLPLPAPPAEPQPAFVSLPPPPRMGKQGSETHPQLSSATGKATAQGKQTQAAAPVPFYTTQLSSFWGEGMLAASPTHIRPTRLSARGQPGARTGPHVLPIPSFLRGSHPITGRAPPAVPCPQQPPHPYIQQGWSHAGWPKTGCTAARELCWEQGQKPSNNSCGDLVGWMNWGEGKAAAPLHLGWARLQHLPEPPALQQDEPAPLST